MLAIHARRLWIGTTAERGGLTLPADAVGALFWDTDETAFYAWDGSAWVVVGSGVGDMLKAVYDTGDNGIIDLAAGGTGANLSATGGAGKYLQQSSAGAAVSVATIGKDHAPVSVLKQGAPNTSNAWVVDASGNLAGQIGGTTFSLTDGRKVDYFSPVGVMNMWPTNTAPTGWLLCYGQAVSRSTYAALFAVIGTTFGAGDGSTTFNLPDMRGRVPLGQDDMGGSSANRVTDTQADSIGGSAGAETHTLATSEMPAHTHGYQTANDITIGSVNGYRIIGNASVGLATTSTGGGGAHNNVQPFLTVNYIIFAGV